MNRQEVYRNCWLIMSTAGRWLAQQDELTRAIHQGTVEAIQDSTDATLDLVLFCLEPDYPELLNTYGKTKIERKAAAFLNSEFAPMPTLFNAFHAEFNTRYFDDRSTHYRVKIMHNIPVPPNPQGYEISCLNKCESQLSIAYNGWPEDMLSSLLALMAHIETGCQRDTSFENGSLG